MERFEYKSFSIIIFSRIKLCRKLKTLGENVQFSSQSLKKKENVKSNPLSSVFIVFLPENKLKSHISVFF